MICFFFLLSVSAPSKKKEQKKKKKVQLNKQVGMAMPQGTVVGMTVSLLCSDYKIYWLKPGFSHDKAVHGIVDMCCVKKELIYVQTKVRSYGSVDLDGLI